jgi:hypothetical protein
MTATAQYRISKWMSSALYCMLQVVAAVGASIFVTGAMAMQASAMSAHSPILCDGPSPAAQTTANMPQAGLTVHYNAKFMEFLYPHLNKYLMCTHMDLPEKAGQTFRNFMSIPLGADTTQQTEGTIGSPEQISVNYRDITIGQYANYNNLSDRAMATSISDDLVENRRILALQLGLTVDNITMAIFDYLRTLDARTSNQDSTTAPYPFTKSIIEQMPGSLGGATVKPMMDGYYNGSIHDFFVSDMLLDNSNNSIVDIWKHTDAGQLRLEPLEGGGETPVKVIELFGCHWRKSTNQTQTPNYLGSGTTALSTYLTGKDAIIFIDFPTKRHTKVEANWERMDLWSGEYARSAYDANNVIGAGTGYNCLFGVGLPPDTTSRARIAKAVPQTT